MKSGTMLNMNQDIALLNVPMTRSWIVVITASFYFLYTFIQLNAFNAIDHDLMRAFHLNALELGRLGSIYFYANALCLFPAGLLLDRFSAKKILLSATIVATIGTFIFGSADTYATAAIGRFIVGASASFSFLSCMRLASRWFPSHKLALASGVIVTMAMTGGLLAQTPLTYLSQMIGWRAAMHYNSLLGLIIFIAIFIIVKDYPRGAEAREKSDHAKIQNIGLLKSIKLVLLNPQNWLGGIYTALLNSPVFLLGAIFGMHYLVQVHHLTILEASYATTVFFVGIIFGAPVFGWFSDYIQRRILPMLLGAFFSLVTILILMYVPDLSLSQIIFLFFLIGFITSSQVLSYPLIAELNPGILTSSAISVVSVTIMLSGVVLQPLFGWLMQLNWHHTIVDGAPVYSANDFLIAMLVMPFAFVIGFIIALFFKETYCKQQG